MCASEEQIERERKAPRAGPEGCPSASLYIYAHDRENSATAHDTGTQTIPVLF